MFQSDQKSLVHYPPKYGLLANKTTKPEDETVSPSDDQIWLSTAKGLWFPILTNLTNLSMDKNLENAYALIIGISKYMDNRISELKYTHADAEDFSKLITDPKRIGLKTENVRVLLDENATLSRIKEAIVKSMAGNFELRTTHFSRFTDDIF